MTGRIKSKVTIIGGNHEFVGQTGTIICKEGPEYRVRLDCPIEIPGVGLVTDDLWDGNLLRTQRQAATAALADGWSRPAPPNMPHGTARRAPSPHGGLSSAAATENGRTARPSTLRPRRVRSATGNRYKNRPRKCYAFSCLACPTVTRLATQRRDSVLPGRAGDRDLAVFAPEKVCCDVAISDASLNERSDCR